MTQQVLNLDAIKTSKTVILFGRSRAVNSMTVEQFIEAEDAEKRLKEAKGADQIKILVDLIHNFVEDTTVEELRKLDFGQLVALLKFIRGEDAIGGEGAGQNPPASPPSS